MTVSLVGRMAMGRSRSLCPALVTHATCIQSTQLHQGIQHSRSLNKASIATDTPIAFYSAAACADIFSHGRYRAVSVTEEQGVSSALSRASTSAAKPSTWSFSVFRAFSVTNSGKLAFWTPSFLISASKKAVMDSQMKNALGRRM